jgi:hypothetical protein
MLQRLWPRVLDLAGRQHGLIARWQLRRLGFSDAGIRWLLRSHRLVPVAHAVYGLGPSPEGRLGPWMAAVLGCGAGAVLSHGSAAGLWDIGAERYAEPEVSVPLGRFLRRRGVKLHRRARLADRERVIHRGVHVTDVTATLIDVASYARKPALANAVRAADARGLIGFEELRAEVETRPPRPGITALRRLLDEHALGLGDSELERAFVPLARAAGLPDPELGALVNGVRVDFFWPALGLVVEVDGLRYHRTPTQQAWDRQRDNMHVAAGLTPLRFTYAQVRRRPGYVTATLATTARRLRERADIAASGLP